MVNDLKSKFPIMYKFYCDAFHCSLFLPWNVYKLFQIILIFFYSAIVYILKLRCRTMLLTFHVQYQDRNTHGGRPHIHVD